MKRCYGRAEAVLLAVMYWAYLGVAFVRRATEEANQATQAARLAFDRLQAERVGVVAEPIVFSGVVTEVIDGETILVRVDGEVYRVRLYGIDCPEPDQSFGEEAADLLAQILDADTVQVRLTGVDHEGRLVGVVLKDGRSVNLELVAAGLARWQEGLAPDEKALAEAQEEAQAAKRGLWADSGPVPP